MSIATEITRLQDAKAAIKTAIAGKGQTVEDTAKLSDFAALIEAISTGPEGFKEIGYATVTTSEFTDTLQVPCDFSEVPERVYIYGHKSADHVSRNGYFLAHSASGLGTRYFTATYNSSQNIHYLSGVKVVTGYPSKSLADGVLTVSSSVCNFDKDYTFKLVFWTLK